MTVYTKWNNMLSKHPIRKSLNLLEETLKEAQDKIRNVSKNSSEFEKNEAEDILEELLKTAKIVKRFSEGLKKSDPTFLNEEMLTKWNGKILAARQGLEAYNHSEKKDAIIASNKILSALLDESQILYTTQTIDELDYYQNEFSKISKHYTSLKNNLTNLENEMSRQVQFLDKEVNALSTSIESQKSRLDTLGDTFSERFYADLEHWNTEMQNKNHEISAFLDYINTDYIVKQKKMLEEAQKTYNLITGTGLAGDYHNVADKARSKASSWQWFHILLLGGLIVFGYNVCFSTNITPESTWLMFLPKLIFLSILVGATKYASNQITYFHNIEQNNRKIELELLALDSYLSSINQEEANKIKAKLAENYFVGQSEKKKENNCENEIQPWVKPLFDSVKEFFTKTPTKS